MKKKNKNKGLLYKKGGKSSIPKSAAEEVMGYQNGGAVARPKRPNTNFGSKFIRNGYSGGNAKDEGVRPGELRGLVPSSTQEQQAYNTGDYKKAGDLSQTQDLNGAGITTKRGTELTGINIQTDDQGNFLNNRNNRKVVRRSNMVGLLNNIFRGGQKTQVIGF